MQQTQQQTVDVRKQSTFMITYKSEDGENLEGQFTTKRLSIRERAAVQVKKSQLNGGMYHDKENPGKGIDEDTDFVNEVMAHLEVALIQVPMWFDLEKIDEMDLLMEVYRQVAEFEHKTNSPLRRAAINDRSSEVDSGTESKQSGDIGSVTPVGGAQVQATLDP